MNPKILISLGVGAVLGGLGGAWMATSQCPFKSSEPLPAPVTEKVAAPAPTPAAAPAKAPEAAPAKAAESVPEAAPAADAVDTEAFNAMGFMVAKQMRLNVGFSDKQMDCIIDGFRKGAADEKMPETYKDALKRAETIYREHAAKIAEKSKLQADENEKLSQAYIDALPDKDKLLKTESGLYYTIITPGNPEKKAAKSDRVKLNYTGSLIDGSVFDKSAEPMELPVSGVVPGFSEGLQLVGEGGKIRLYIPGSLGYGVQPPPGSPMKPGSMLIFDVEVLNVVPGRKTPSLNASNMKVPGLPPGMTPPPPPTGKMRTPPAPPTTPPPTTPPPPLPAEALKNRPSAPPPLPAGVEAQVTPEPAKAEAVPATDKTETDKPAEPAK